VKVKYPSDLVGLRFGNLTVESKQPNDRLYKTSLWNCICDCGESRVVQRSALVCGIQVSCGCYNKKRIIETHTIHGLHGHSAYGTWKAMMDRCYNPLSKDYPDYGGRGIQVCENWQEVAGFIAGMGEKQKGQSIDRIDENGDYAPDNCRWTDAKGQGEHKRNNAMVNHQGVIKHLAGVWRDTGMKESTLYNRLKAGLTVDEASSKPVREHNATLIIDGVEKTLVDWAAVAGVTRKTIRNRMNAGLVGADVLRPPISKKTPN